MQSRLKLPMKVWDLPTRLFHWSLVVLVATSYVSIHEGWIQIHLIAGYVMLGMIVFRLIWGVVGSETARFARFLKSPLAALAHLARMYRREEDREVGHNAAAGWMVIAMLLCLAVQVGSGLCANTDDSFFVNGPLAVYVGSDWSNQLSRLHAYNFDVLLVLIGVHLLAVVAYAVLKRQDLVRPMVTGKKRLPGATRQPRMASPLRAILVIAVAAVVAVAVANLPQ